MKFSPIEAATVIEGCEKKSVTMDVFRGGSIKCADCALTVAEQGHTAATASTGLNSPRGLFCGERAAAVPRYRNPNLPPRFTLRCAFALSVPSHEHIPSGIGRDAPATVQAEGMGHDIPLGLER
jgi:hypothetical protein